MFENIQKCYSQIIFYTPSKLKLTLHRGLGRGFCGRYEVANARIQILTNLVSNESLKPRGYRFDQIFVKFLHLVHEISI